LESYELYNCNFPEDVRYVGITVMGLSTRLSSHMGASKREDYPVSRWIRKHREFVRIRKTSSHKNIEDLVSFEIAEIARLRSTGILLNATSGGHHSSPTWGTGRKQSASRFITTLKTKPFYKGTTNVKILGINQASPSRYFILFNLQGKAYYGGSYPSVEEAIPYLLFLQNELGIPASKIPSGYKIIQKSERLVGDQATGLASFKRSCKNSIFYKNTDMPKIRCIPDIGRKKNIFEVKITKNSVAYRFGTHTCIYKAIDALHNAQESMGLILSDIPEYYVVKKEF
jgi:hypothetical protein